MGVCIVANPQTVYAVIRSIRACFNRLKTLGDALHEDIAVTSAMRAVMESLADHGAQTVPDIARSKSVSRQHIQTLVDHLQDAGLVTFKDNPSHKRSSLVDLTAKGRRTFKNMQAREKAVLTELAAGFSERDMATTAQTLQQFEERLNTILNQGDDDE